MTNTMKAKLQEQLADPTFYNDLCNCMKSEEALAYFAQHDLELEEKEALETWNTAMEEANRTGPLTDEELELVAGGSNPESNCWKVCLCVFIFGGCREWGCLEGAADCNYDD